MALPANYSREVPGTVPGSTTVPILAQNMSVQLGLNGIAGLHTIILPRRGVSRGLRVILKVGLPAIAGVILDLRDNAVDGTQLLPAETFPDQTFTSDGITVSATFELVYKGSAWLYVESSIPS